MKIKLILVAAILLLLFFSERCEKYTFYYSYGNKIVKRVDTPGRSTFYFPAENTESKIWAEYSGINDGFEGYLVFEGKRVVIVEGEGFFQSEDLDTNTFTHRRFNWSEKDAANVYRIAFPQEYEQNRNELNVTRVKVKTNE